MDNGASSYRRFLKGDTDGFVEIVRQYRDGLILFINSFVGNISDAEELAEDTFVAIGLKHPHFSEKSSFKTWLYSIGRHIAIDFIRKNAKHKTAEINENIKDEVLLEEAYIKKERDIVLHRAMGKLKSEYRQVLWLHYFESFGTKEISVIMNKSVHCIETLTYRARQSLKEELKTEGFDYENL